MLGKVPEKPLQHSHSAVRDERVVTTSKEPLMLLWLRSSELTSTSTTKTAAKLERGSFDTSNNGHNISQRKALIK